MMHALGIVHEQSRPDRDDHVEVLQENVKESKQIYDTNFEIEVMISKQKGGLPTLPAD